MKEKLKMCGISLLKVVPNLLEGTAPCPTPANLESWWAPASSGARPWQLGSLVRRQRARPSPPST